MSERSILSKDSAITFGLAFTMIGAAFTFGVMYQRFTTLEVRVQTVETRLVQFQTDFNRLFYPEKNQPSRTARK